MVTAYGREEVQERARNVDFKAHLVKPVSASALFDAVVGVLGADGAPAGVRPANGRQPMAAMTTAALRGARLLLVEDNQHQPGSCRGHADPDGNAG